ncbi:hypothetical protein PoB_002380000 [Plakobranchus ocellatus]|uniref:Uncharacterized protein n=1 Tax=Plakobranchus ocellatus TaxID=259542 RepID=A0AAV3ZNL8_9GAST|nr:hypothetical protein PoB_002380000 [Plakobranchus ocellatus]
MISGSQALCQARAPIAGLEPTAEVSLQVSGWILYPLRHRRRQTKRMSISADQANTEIWVTSCRLCTTSNLPPSLCGVSGLFPRFGLLEAHNYSIPGLFTELPALGKPWPRSGRQSITELTQDILRALTG